MSSFPGGCDDAQGGRDLSRRTVGGSSLKERVVGNVDAIIELHDEVRRRRVAEGERDLADLRVDVGQRRESLRIPVVLCANGAAPCIVRGITNGEVGAIPSRARRGSAWG